MGIITIVGLGPGDPRLLTREAWEVLEAAKALWLRTERHPTVDGLPSHLALFSFDHVYKEAEDFEQVYHTIASQLLHRAQQSEGIVYAVPGHPLVGEATVRQILARAEASGTP